MKNHILNKLHIRVLLIVVLFSTQNIAQYYLDSLNSLVENLPPNIKMSKCNDIADDYRRDDPRTAIIFAEKALNISKNQNDRLNEARALKNLGSANFLIQNNSLAIEYLMKAEKLSKELKAENILAEVYQNLGFSFKYDTKFLEAINYYQESISIWNKLENNERNIASSLSAIANIYRVFDNYPQAIELYLEALELYNKINFDEGVAWIDFNIGVLHKKNKDFIKAKEYITRAFNRYESLFKVSEVKNKNGLAMCYSQLSSIERKLGDPKKAIELGEKALEIRLISGLESVIAEEYSNLGRIHLDIGNISKAKDYLELSLANKKESMDKNGMAIIYGSLAKIEIFRSNYKEAEKLLQKSLFYAKQTKSLYNIHDAYLIYSEMYEKRGLNKKALEMHKLYTTYKDSIFSNENSRKVLITEIQYQSKAKEEENQYLRAENRIKELEISEGRIYRYLLIAIILFIVLLVILFFSKYKNQKAANIEIDARKDELNRKNKELLELTSKLTESNAEKDKFFSIISHDLKSPFTSLLGYSKMLNENYSEFTNEDIKEINSSMSNSIKNVYQLIEDLLSWANTQTGRSDFLPEKLQLNYIVSNVVDLCKNDAETKGININYKIHNEQIVFADKNMLNAILRNLISNSIKFSNRNDNIFISSITNGDFIKVSVQDTGIGIDNFQVDELFKLDIRKSRNGTNNETGTGLGLTICKEFVEKNGGEIWAESEVNVGTTFYFTLKKI